MGEIFLGFAAARARTPDHTGDALGTICCVSATGITTLSTKTTTTLAPTCSCILTCVISVGVGIDATIGGYPPISLAIENVSGLRGE